MSNNNFNINFIKTDNIKIYTLFSIIGIVGFLIVLRLCFIYSSNKVAHYFNFNKFDKKLSILENNEYFFAIIF